METEKVYQEKTARTLQKKQEGSGALQFVDNRPSNQLLQRMGDEDEDTLQGRFINPVQRTEEEEDTLQGKFEQPVQKKNETGMPDRLKAGIEELSGFAMDDVRVHYNSDKPATVQALAYTQGTDIHVAPGQERHLPHEAWHVAQQMAGRVEPTTEVGGLPVNDNPALEHEADVMGAKAMQMKNERHKIVLNSDGNKKKIELNPTQKKSIHKNDKHCLKPYYKISRSLDFPIQRVVDLYRSKKVWTTPNYDSEWCQGSIGYQQPEREAKEMTKMVANELEDGIWYPGHMVNGTLCGGHGGCDNIEPITSELNCNMKSLENTANNVATNSALEYKYMMEGFDEKTWSRKDNQNRKVTNLITKYKGTLTYRTQEHRIQGRLISTESGYIREPDKIKLAGQPIILTKTWEMSVRDGIEES